ncbi:MAG: HAD family hydrolase [Clostridia bacterium]|nr:HAD family hydrolase [Clostridia bacterium]
MKTLFLSDLDGTFLNSNGEISENSRRIISQLIDKGVLFTVATARTYATVMQMFKGINLPCPLVLMNGVTLYDPSKKKIISSNPIPTELGNRIIAEFRKRNIEPMLYFQQGETLEIYYSVLTNDYQREYVAQRTDCNGKKFICSPEGVSIEGRNLVYIVCLDFYENIKDVYEAVSEFEDAHCMFYKDNYSDMYFLEIITRTVSKASGALQVKEAVGADRMIAFGDNLNDIPLFEAADEAYAVSNAHDDLKKLATAVIDSNDSDAVARFILEKYNKCEIQ